MAEIIQRGIEDKIPELEQLERIGLFTKKEVKSVIRSTTLQYKLFRTILSKEDFIAYIQHIGYQFKREEIEYAIIHRIHTTFRRTAIKPCTLSFCFQSTKSQLSKVFSSMLAIHPDKPALWIMAAKCEMEDRNSTENARLLFLRALRFHPDNKKVYQEYFRMELLHAEKLKKQQQELEKAKISVNEYEFSPEILSGKLAEVIYRNATQKIKGADFILSLLQIASIFDFTKELQENILEDLQSQHTDDSLTWDFMAKRELGVAVTPELQTARGKATDTNRKEERCCAVYEEGLKCISTEAMWTCYVTFCLERYKRKTNVQELKEKRRARLLGVFQRAHDAALLKEDLYKSWVRRDAEATTQIATAATQRFSQSAETWSLALQVLVQLRSSEAARLFQEALGHVSPKVSASKGLFSSVATVSTTMKQKYLDWSYKTGGYKKARKTFTSLHEHRPFSKAFFTRMIEIEKEQERPKMNNLRDYYERALREFGSSDEDLWMDYIKEERRPNGKPENCGTLHWRAIKMLEGESVERFTAQYTLLQTGHV
uniref:UTP6 small subunit processome component n=1 Tax=Denticeps clupeoides TaxID=299321 RepID=A0AAY4AI04_9TELE